MKRLLLMTTAIGALALAPALAIAQVQSNGPSGTIQEQPRDQQQKAPQGKAVTPMPGASGKSAQTQTEPTPAPQQGQPQHQQRMQGQAQPKKEEPGDKTRMQGQAQPQMEKPGSQPKLQGQMQPSGQQHVEGQAQPATGAQQRSTGTASTSKGAGGKVQVTEQQRTQIHERISHVRVQRIDHPQFSVTVGAEIPRSVHVEVLPPEIVEVVPEYQGFDYVMVGDEILIVDPGSLQIVAVIPV